MRMASATRAQEESDAASRTGSPARPRLSCGPRVVRVKVKAKSGSLNCFISRPSFAFADGNRYGDGRWTRDSGGAGSRFHLRLVPARFRVCRVVDWALIFVTGARSMKITFAASEATPFAKTGGLADVVGALPRELVKLGHQVTVFLPFYARVRRQIEGDGGRRAAITRFDRSPSRSAITTGLSAWWTAASAMGCSTTLSIARNCLIAKSFMGRAAPIIPTMPSGSGCSAARCSRPQSSLACRTFSMCTTGRRR